jgi:hypothetical protein
LHVFYNFPFRVFVREFAYMSLVNTAILLRILLSYRQFLYTVKTLKISENESKFARRIQIIKALAFFVFKSTSLLIEKIKRNRLKKKVTIEENYSKILSGDWYLK